MWGSFVDCDSDRALLFTLGGWKSNCPSFFFLSLSLIWSHPRSRQALTVSPIPSLAPPSTLAVRFCLGRARVMMPLIVLANMTNREQDYLWHMGGQDGWASGSVSVHLPCPWHGNALRGIVGSTVRACLSASWFLIVWTVHIALEISLVLSVCVKVLFR